MKKSWILPVAAVAGAIFIGWVFMQGAPDVATVQAPEPAPEEGVSQSGVALSDGATPSNVRAPGDGRRFGYLDVTAGNGTVLFDEASWLSGDEAVRAARARGEEAPNLFYIENRDPGVEYTLTLSPSAKITRVDMGGPGGVRSVPSTLADLAKNGVDWQANGDQVGVQKLQVLAWVVIGNGVVVEIEEQYTP